MEAFGASSFLVSFVSSFASDFLSDSTISSIKIGEPCFILSPTFKRISFTVPLLGAGISMDALSDSSVMRGSSFLIESPTLAITSITSTLSKLPISGTSIFSIAIITVSLD